MLTVHDVEVLYQGVIRVLRGISLEVGEGQIVTLVGANGAGKSTTLKAISGLLAPEQGRVTGGNIVFNGRPIHNRNAADVAALGIIHVAEGHQVFEHLTVLDNLMAGAHDRGDRGAVHQSLERVYQYFPRLKDLQRQTAGYISGGEQQMLVIGRALMARPKLLLLDEPSMGLAPLLVRELFQIVDRINQEEGMAILLVEQNVRVALTVAGYGYVMESGRIVLDGTAERLEGNEDVKEFYLGLSAAGTRKSYREVKHYKRRKRWL